MSAMQERGKLRKLNGCKFSHTNPFDNAQCCDPCADIILSFAAQREAKARREAIEECAKVCASLRTNTKHGDGWRNSALNAAEAGIRALLQPPATEKCEHYWEDGRLRGFTELMICAKCQASNPKANTR